MRLAASLALLILSFPAEAAAPTPELLLLEGWSDPSLRRKPIPRWTFEAIAAVIAIGTVGETVERDGRQHLTITLEEILWGEAVVGEVFPEDTAPHFGCIGPPSVDRPSEHHPPGTKLMIRFERREGRLRILHLFPRPESLKKYRDFLELRAAVHTPEPDWAKVLELVKDGDPERKLRILLKRNPRPAARAELIAYLDAQIETLGDDEAAKRLELLRERVSLG